MMRNMILSMSLLASIAACGFAADPDYSGGYRGPNRDGIYRAGDLLDRWPEDGPQLLWKDQTIGDGFSAVMVADGTVYVTGKHHDDGEKNGYLSAFTLDGTLKWKKKYGPETSTGRFEGPRATPQLVSGNICLVSGKGVLYAMDAQTGEMKWSVDLRERYGLQVPGWGYNETPLVVDNKLVMSIRRGEVSLVAVDADTGQTVWTTPQPESAYACGDSSAILVDLPQADIIFHHLWHAAVALDPDTGAVLWQIKTKHGSQLTPVHNEGCLFMATGTDKSYRMLQFADDGREFKELWRRQDIQPISQAVFLNDMLFVFGRERTPEDKEGRSRKRNEPALLCFDVKTGDLIKQQVVMEGNGSLIAADGKLYCVEGAERHWKTPLISLVEPTDGGFELVGRFTPEVGTKECYVNVTLHNGRMFHRHGRLLAVYDVRAR